MNFTLTCKVKDLKERITEEWERREQLKWGIVTLKEHRETINTMTNQLVLRLQERES